MLDFISSQIFGLKDKKGLIILLYHRIDNVEDDPHLLCVSPSNFARQMKWLGKNVKVLSLPELLKLRSRNNIRGCYASITFDDGYSDNLYNALPILEKYNQPATMFITSDMVNNKKPFYWDIKSKKDSRGRALTKNELIRLSSSKLIEIGNHSETHPHLSQLRRNLQVIEVVKSKETLEKEIHTKISGFSYPFGKTSDYNKTTLDLIRKAGYKYACANFPSKVGKSSKIFELPRFIIRNWNIFKFKNEINKFYEYPSS